MRVLVIGGCGFLGSHIVDAFLLAGHEVRVFDVKPEQMRSPSSVVEYILGDASSSALLYEALLGVEVVFHAAGATVPATATLDPVFDVKSNLIATLNILNVIKTSNVSRLVYLSSGGTVYGVPRVPLVDESHPRDPISSYGIVKSAVESYVLALAHSTNIQPVVLRVSNPYGPRQGHTGLQGIIGTYLANFALRKPIVVWGDGTIVRDYLFASDFGRLCLSVAERDCQSVYNAASGVGASVLDVLAAVEEAVGEKIEPTFQTGRSFDIPRVVLSIDRANRDLGWSPTVDLAMGVKATWQWVQTSL